MGLILENYNYAVVIVLMMTGLYVVFASRNMIKKLVGLSVFQTSVFLLYISIGKVTGGVPPIIELGHGDDHGGGHEKASDAGHAAAGDAGHAATDAAHGAVDASHAPAHAAETLYSNPLPHVLILTAIVVGVATLAIGLALVVRTREAYGTIDEEEIDQLDYEHNLEGLGS